MVVSRVLYDLSTVFKQRTFCTICGDLPLDVVFKPVNQLQTVQKAVGEDGA